MLFFSAMVLHSIGPTQTMCHPTQIWYVRKIESNEIRSFSNEIVIFEDGKRTVDRNRMALRISERFENRHKTRSHERAC